MPFPSRIEGKKEGKRAALDAERAQRAARKRKRDEGIAMLKEHNIFVDSLPGGEGSGSKRLVCRNRAAGRFSAPRGEITLLFPPRHS
jgi:hypothetical protein